MKALLLKSFALVFLLFLVGTLTQIFVTIPIQETLNGIDIDTNVRTSGMRYQFIPNPITFIIHTGVATLVTYFFLKRYVVKP